MARTTYLAMHTLVEARRIWFDRFGTRRVGEEEVAVRDARARVTAKPVFARRSVPHYHGAAMDGIAVEASNTFGASDRTPRRLKLGTEAFPVDTGDPLPEGTNAVVMIEQVFPAADGYVELRTAAYPWQHVRKVGEDIVAGELVLPANHQLRPVDLGALLATGIATVSVYRRPKVWIQPTGDEIVSPLDEAAVQPGKIVEFNGTMLAALVEECWAEPMLKDVIPDHPEVLRRRLIEACESDADVVLINAGSSAGSEDYTVHLLKELGEVFVHGVTMMPGKPVILGSVKEKPVVGIPGYPVSAVLAFEQFVRPLLWRLQGLADPPRETLRASMARKVASKLGLEEFVRVVLGEVGGRTVAVPIQRGAGTVTSLTRADGIVRVPHNEEGVNAGDEVTVELLRPSAFLPSSLIMIGSHDNTVDIIASELKRLDGRIHLSSSNVGSLGGLLALRRSYAHLAGSHLLDTYDGSYNYSYIERYLQWMAVRLVELTKREQGFLIAPGNPKGIASIEDLRRPDVRFINRQAGAGTRVLFDYELDRAGIMPSSVCGYDQEEYTHMAVAVAVLSGRADVGMGIYAAAKALGLAFIPIAQERYDLVIRADLWDDPRIVALLEVIRSERFRMIVRSLGGYDPSCSGTLIGVWDGTRWEMRP